jgi:Anti-sigma factor NepR
LRRLIPPKLFMVERNMSKSKKRETKPMRFVNAVDPDFDPISAALRQMHEGVASEPVPDEFLLLLDQLDARMAEKNKKPS